MSLPLGTVVNMTGPHGFFVLDPAHAGDIVFGATGTGIAAVMPMLGELGRRRASGERGAPLHRHVGGPRGGRPVRARGDRALRRGRRRRSAHLPDRPRSQLDRGRGRITAALLESLPQLVTPTFYLVGNGAMITEVKRELIGRGVNRKAQIRTEAFFD